MVLSSKISETDGHLATIQQAKRYYRGIYDSGDTGEDLLKEMTPESKAEE